MSTTEPLVEIVPAKPLTAPAAEEQQPLTDEQMAKLSQQVAEGLFPTNPAAKAPAKETKADKPDETKAAEADKKAEAERQAEEKRLQEEKAEADRKQKQKDDEAAAKSKKTEEDDELAERIAGKLANKLPKPATTAKAEEPADAADDQPAAPDEEQRTREVLTVLEENPKYRGITAKLDEFLAAEKKYIADWQKKNPGKEFDAEDQSHATFYDKHEPQFEEADYIKAEARYEARKETQTALAKRDAEQYFQHAEAQAAEVAESAIAQAIEEAAPDLKEVAGDWDKLREQDPVAAAILQRELAGLDMRVAETMLIFDGRAGYRADTKNNPVHRDIFLFVGKAEGDLAKLPAEQSARQGKSFATLSEFKDMTPNERAQHWTLWSSPGLVKTLMVRDASARAKAEISRVTEYTQRKYGAAQAASGQKSGTQGGQAASDKAADSKVEKPNPPSTASAADMATGGNHGKSTPDEIGKIIAKGLFS